MNGHHLTGSTTSGNMEHIKLRSGQLKQISQLLGWLLPIACISFWSLYNELPATWKTAHILTFSPYLPPYSQFLGCVASLLPVSVAMYALFILARLFSLYERGFIFDQANVSCYRRLGWSLLAWAAASFLYSPCLSLALSVGRPQGQGMLVVALDSSEIFGVFVGAVVLVVSQVMQEAQRIEEEQSLTI